MMKREVTTSTRTTRMTSKRHTLSAASQSNCYSYYTRPEVL